MTDSNADISDKKSELPLVTVYITNYNYDEYLRMAIESVLEQTFRDFELIILDDGSTDSSREIIREYADHEKTRVIFQENRGLNKSIDVAIKASRGKYVMRLDADDFLDSNALLVLTREIEQNDDLALVFPDYFYVDEDGEILGQERRNDFKEEVTVPDRPAHGACTLFRKRVLEEVGSYTTDYTCQDGYDIWLKIINKYSVKNINLPLFYYRRHGENLTENNERILRTRSEIKKDFIKENGPLPTTIGIVPVRGKIIDPKSAILDEFGGKPVLEWTLEAAENVDQIEELVVTTPDSDVIEHVESRDGSVTVHERSPELARENVTLRETILSVLDNYDGNKFDSVAQLTPNTPFRTTRAIEEAISTLEVFPVDVVIGVIPEDDKFYIHDGDGLQPIGQARTGRDLRLERERLFRNAGGLKIIDREHLIDGSNVDTKIGHVVLQDIENLNISNPEDIRRAEIYLD